MRTQWVQWAVWAVMALTLVVVGIAVLGACAAPLRVVAIAASRSGVAVSCAPQAGSSGRPRVVILPASQARSVHVGDVCPA